MSYGQMRGGAGSRSVVHAGRSGRQKHIPNYSLKRRRRTVTRPDPRTPRELYHALKPAFIGFLCEWSGCKANLHNMDTLRRHVDAIHLKPREQHCCLWGKCGEQSVARQIDGVALATHLEQAHLVPMTWHVGDGPKNSCDWSTKLEADAEVVADFLKDKEGNQVTPSTRDQLVEDLQTYRTNRRKLKELILRRDENLDSQSSDASEDEDIGSGL
ncbi:C2H2 finger domain-containing protein [Beauveria brongniartii RCEF 3172]|uniref:C2H2 finger domain-containing protein n=1 Tax=Beauveria brongniartii RCEF 3172 TaxID=1081107 RepID=A0A162M0F0_9HYPO|nr:C2H2 finger domain-containing protein [Beauveria brongniartii RCEF 3172]